MGNYLEEPITVEHSLSLSSLIPRCAFTDTHMHTERPITTQRDGMGREVGGGFKMGNTYKSMADSYQCMAKTTTIL